VILHVEGIDARLEKLGLCSFLIDKDVVLFVYLIDLNVGFASDQGDLCMREIGETIFSALLAPKRRKTPGVSRTSVLPTWLSIT